MNHKIAAHFRSSHRTNHSFQRLQQCKGCGSYSALWVDVCLSCGEQGKFALLPNVVNTILKRNAQRDVLIISTAALAALFLARNLLEMAVSLLVGILFILFYLLLRRRYLPYLHKSMLHNILQKENPTIRDGLLLDTEDAANDLKANDYKLAYEKLREIGYLLSGNQVKILKVICLNHFNLRKDMDLELSTLLPEGFDPDFVLYLFEVSKVNPELVKRDVINYALRYRAEIEALPGGRAVLMLVLTAALRVKTYVLQYESQIADFIEEFPRERLVRLSRLIAESPAAFPILTPKLQGLIKRSYDSDPEFKGLL